MQNKTKVYVIAGVVLFLLIALILAFSLRKKPQTTSSPQKQASVPQKVTLEEKLDSPTIGISISYPKSFKVVKNDNQNFSLVDNSNSSVMINIQKLAQNSTGNSKDIYSLIDSLKKSFLKIDPKGKFFNETKFLKNQNNNAEKFPGIGFEVQYSFQGKDIKYFLAAIQKGSDYYIFSLSAPLSDYPNKIGVITSMLGTLSLK